ncbi:hypothetical protein BRC90_06520 [Halobacteriales archaeon QS_4_69_34]|nr:MAG: hypothetical protein BRC90_06520 [Halobacteriales archaeon QS_4_69_34]
MTVRLDALEKEQRATTASEGVELQTEVFDALPTPPSGVETPIGEALTGAEPDVTEWGATVENLSDDLDTPEEAVRDALDGLKETTSQVEGRYTDDGTYHFKRE